jgi:hypothetical protein
MLTHKLKKVAETSGKKAGTAAQEDFVAEILRGFCGKSINVQTKSALDAPYKVLSVDKQLPQFHTQVSV